MFAYTLPLGVWIAFVIGLAVGAGAVGYAWLCVSRGIEEQIDFHRGDAEDAEKV